MTPFEEGWVKNVSVRPESKQIVELIRRVMKQRKLRLHNLAAALEVSLPTAKRLVNGADLSLDRLLAICDWLEISLSQLVAMVDMEAGRVQSFTAEQEQFFAENPSYLAYFWVLLSKRLTPEEIEAHYGLSRRSTNRYQASLERLGLLSRGKGISIKLKKDAGSYTWDDRGLLGQTYTRHFLSEMVQRAVDQLEKPQNMRTRTGGRWLTSEQQSEFLSEFDALVKKYRITSDINRLSDDRGHINYVSYAFLIDQWNDPFFEEITEL